MSPADGVVGAVLGAGFGLGAWVVVDTVVRSRRTSVAVRVLPYLRDLPQTPPLRGRLMPLDASTLLRRLLGRLAATVGDLLGGAASVQRRLTRAGSPMTVHDVRVSQVVWGLVGFAVAAVPAGVLALGAPGRSLPLLLCCVVAGALGVMLRENRLSAEVTRHEQRILEEFPTVAQLLALAVAAGEGPVAALRRVVARTQGALSGELRAVLAEVHTGTPVAAAFDHLAARTGLPVLARFAEGVAVAVERGTPLADVLHAQAGDVREAGRRALIEAGARKEVFMMVPVVFLVMPVVIVFAFFPGLIGLRLVV